ncbi:MAG: class I SAM-dependent methyltransferase [Dehalococcoidia bacterium]
MSQISGGQFDGTARYYARYRPPYPQQLLRILQQTYNLDGTGRLLDLGCGTGNLTLPLAPYFSETVAIDADAEMLQEAERAASARHMRSITWYQGRAEEVSTELGQFKLVTIANAFHWMDRDLVLARCAEVLPSGGGLALLGGGGSWWNSDRHWHRAVMAIVRRWLGARRRAGAGFYEVSEEPFSAAVKRSAFRVIDSGQVEIGFVWDVESIIGHLYSTTFCSPTLLGHNCGRFEDDLTAMLAELTPHGRFEDMLTFTYLLTRKR